MSLNGTSSDSDQSAAELFATYFSSVFGKDDVPPDCFTPVSQLLGSHSFYPIQVSLDSVARWCIRNKMSLNVSKCNYITFHRISNPVRRNYTIDGKELARCSEIVDLGVLFTPNLSWDRQVHSVCNKALRNLGLIHRVSSTFNSIYSLKLLFLSLVRPHLEYCDIIWSPHQQYLKDELESVQRRFVRLVGTRLGYRFLEAPIDDLQSLLKLPSLESRRFNHDVLFLQRLVTSELDCPELLQKVGNQGSHWYSLHQPLHDAVFPPDVREADSA
ncbi:uncharacterized protein LOC128999398 [Macrosteles quadrilineatus]|uniref:uncharacterized protein LOC128999398 n=1 Tax=Macrosteles quadrilineatus TaxID=74068 RepID=UPI0023E106E7|nr:uncharacterized protein LOC128999398 [Macrosteles quadrilineatus]